MIRFIIDSNFFIPALFYTSLYGLVNFTGYHELFVKATAYARQEHSVLLLVLLCRLHPIHPIKQSICHAEETQFPRNFLTHNILMKTKQKETR